MNRARRAEGLSNCQFAIPPDHEFNAHSDRGVILPNDPAPSAYRRPATDVFLALLYDHESANRRPLSETANANNFAPRVFARAAEKQRDSYGEGEFRRAMETLFRERKIVSADYGRKGDERKKIVRNPDGE